MNQIDDMFRRVDEQIIERMATARCPGMAVAFVDRQRCVRIATYGVVSLETRAPVTPQTRFRIGSITKSFVALAVVQLAQRGELDLHRPVVEYLPWWSVATRYAPITLHHLLTHTAGLVVVVDRSPDQRGAVWALRETETAWAPGERFHYSDAGYQTLALVLVRVTGVPFAEVIATQILAPLGMRSSVAAVTQDLRPLLATGYRDPYDDRPSDPTRPLVPAPFLEVEAGDCSIASTAEDMAAYARLLLNAGRGPQSTLLAPEWFHRLTHPHTHTGSRGTHYGYGIELRTMDGRVHLEHGGGVPGFVAHLNVDRDSGVAVVTLSTTPHVSGISWEILRAWRAASLGEPLEPFTIPAPRPATSQTTSTAVDAADGVPAAWGMYPGHFRAHNPWATNFRVVLRPPHLWLIWPHGGEERLIPYDGSNAPEGEFYV
ncbi:MAG: beta-lactamase family protein, partial [Chloroflexota bacterium]|nr:beta-lactamase family protein [Chloroflexota bacterium]